MILKDGEKKNIWTKGGREKMWENVKKIVEIIEKRCEWDSRQIKKWDGINGESNSCYCKVFILQIALKLQFHIRTINLAHSWSINTYARFIVFMHYGKTC